MYIEIFIRKNTEVNNLLWNESKIRQSNGLKQGRIAGYSKSSKARMLMLLVQSKQCTSRYSLQGSLSFAACMKNVIVNIRHKIIIIKIMTKVIQHFKY